MSSTTAVSTPAITRVPLWINGQAARSTSERSGDVTNPATGEVIRIVEVPAAPAEEKI